MKSQRRYLQVTNQTQDTVLCARAMLADTTITRIFGLLGKAALSSSEGLLIRPSSGVHTWGMGFAIDIVALGPENCVLGLWRAIGPWHIRGLSFRTRSILELAPGAIERSGTNVGDQLILSSVDA